MSDLHKSFLKRIKNHEQSLGLGSLSEEQSNDDEQELESLSKSEIESKDTKIVDEFEQFKTRVFPVIERFTDPSSGIEFQTYYRPPGTANSPLFVCHHGAGSSSMTFAKLTETFIQKSDTSCEPGILLYDMRGHGKSSNANDFGLSSITADFKFIIDTFLSKNPIPNGIYLLGHSLGGSVLTNYLVTNPDNGYNVKGLIVLDIVEDTAVKALSAMPKFISSRPETFNSYNDCIDWHIGQSNLLNSYESACLSVPDLLTSTSENKLKWRTCLSLTEPFWDTWFEGLSENFITSGKSQHVAKLLILSGHETLDTNLIIGQMQGKYQLVVFNNNNKVGHFIHEDIPSQIVLTLIDFYRRNDSPGEYMKKELGIVPKWGGKINS